jgi:dolichol-phosphate mannosyltransferase
MRTKETALRCLVVVPTHNEATNIEEILARLHKHVPEADVLVIDDASTDATRTLARAALRPNDRIVERETKSGLGNAYLHAFGIGLDEQYDLLVQIDADMSHDPVALPTMLAVAQHGVAVVIGINDATAGYRVYRADALRSLDLAGIQASGYGFQIEMTYRAVRSGMSVVEIPITFRDRVAGESKMSRRIVVEAFQLVTWWGVNDLVTLRRRRRAYRTLDQATLPDSQ